MRSAWPPVLLLFAVCAAAFASGSRVQAVPATDAPSGSLLANGGFEVIENGRPASWTKTGGELETDASAFAGAVAARLASETASTKWIAQVVAVEPERSYSAAVRGRISAGSGEIWIRLSWYAAADGTGTALSQVDGNRAGTSEWTLLLADGNAPDDARSVRVRLMFRPAGAGSASFDEAGFVRVEAALTAGTATASASPTVDLPAAMGNLRLSEVMADPTDQPDAAHEWVELVNAGPEAMSTAGWKIGNARALDALPSVTVPPGGFLVVAAKSVVAPADALVVRIADGTIGGGLRNGGDIVRVVDPGGEERDALSYGDRPDVFDPPLAVPGAGESLAARTVSAEAGSESWAIAARPTPGEANRFPAPAEADRVDRPPPGVTVVSDSGRSAVPWIMLTVAGIAGLGGVGALASRHLPARIRKRTSS